MSPETRDNATQPTNGIPFSEQYGRGLAPEPFPYLDMPASMPPAGVPVTMQPVYPQASAVTQPQGFTPAGNQPPARRRSWKAYAAGMALLVLLMFASFGVGRLLVGGANTATPSNTGSSITLPATVSDLQQTIIAVTSQVQPSVVEVTSQGQSGEAIGSGIILTSDGYIATNDHVVSGYSSYTVRLSSGKTLQAELIGQDAQDDLAVLKIDASGLQPITFADSSKVQVGQFALALGSPLGLEDTTTFGIVSAVNRTESEAPDGPASVLTGMIQTSAAINPGNSGGALVNLQGELIGMPTLGASVNQNGSAADDIGFAIPSNRIKFVTDQLISSGKLTSSGQGFLGIQGQDVTAQLAATEGLSSQQGVLVTGFASDTDGNSPARQAGLQAGDVIVAVNGEAVSDNAELAGAMLSQQPGTKVTLTVERGGAQHTITVTLGERPVSS